ncbi:hypothetical protein SAMN04488056_101388 [Cohaesibacter marisflavi]|uniref:Uncharacterized protein n=1 Tax=Cohaesibacter marisflavi TaxID=655353 RepID=A0A1I5A8H8_9HYPH|nr:hypothetical protein SAMN04488056_101388 [Cohaesibacter marisflavi]
MIKASVIIEPFTGKDDWRHVLVVDKPFTRKRCPNGPVVEARCIGAVYDILANMQMVTMGMRQAENGNRAIGVPCLIRLRARQNLGQDKGLQLQFIEFKRIDALHEDETFHKKQERSSNLLAAAAFGALRRMVGRIGPTRIDVFNKPQLRRKRQWLACQPLFLKRPVMLADAS